MTISFSALASAIRRFNVTVQWNFRGNSRDFRDFRRTPVAVLLLALGTPAVADGLVDNVNGITLDDKGQVVRFTGLTVTADGKVGRLIRQGEKPSPDKNWRPDWRLDGKNRTLLPGLFDAHGHVMGMGIAALTLDLSDTKTLAEAQAKIADYAKAHPERRWVIGRGWNQ